jgi:hypothetical protein
VQAAWKKGSKAGPGRSESKSGNGLGLCRRDAGGTAGEGAPTAPVGRSLALPLSGGQRSGGPAALVLAGFYGWGAHGAAVGGLKKHTEVATLVWDGAPGHRDGWVRELGMPLIGLPPYSPELHPAERVFQEVRRAIEGKVDATLEDKMMAVAEFLRELEAAPERVRSLTWWDWIKTAVQQLPSNYAA